MLMGTNAERQIPGGAAVGSLGLSLDTVSANCRPVAEGLFEWPCDRPRLIGGQCRECGVVTFPGGERCPKCGAKETESIALPTRGTLWTFTTQDFALKEPYRGAKTEETFEPFGLGYIDLDGKVKVEALLTEHSPEKLTIGMSMDLVLIPLYVDSDGTEVITYAFAPTRESQG